jgi:hypothetical protein
MPMTASGAEETGFLDSAKLCAGYVDIEYVPVWTKEKKEKCTRLLPQASVQKRREGHHSGLWFCGICRLLIF